MLNQHLRSQVTDDVSADLTEKFTAVFSQALTF